MISPESMRHEAYMKMKAEEERKKLLQFNQGAKVPVIRNAANVFRNMQAQLTVDMNSGPLIMVSNQTNLTRIDDIETYQKWRSIASSSIAHEKS